MENGILSRRAVARSGFGALLGGTTPVPAVESATSGWFDVVRYGALPGKADSVTAAIQKAIDDCSQRGGGFVYFPPGKYVAGTLVLKNGVRLFLAPGAELMGSRRLDDYPVHRPKIRSYTDYYTERSLIYAENATGIGILGFGTIDGQGESFAGPYKVRPYLIRMVGCHDVTLQDVTLRNSAMWVQHYLACQDVRIAGIQVRSLRPKVNNDGIDIDSSERVRISDCDIQAGDDAIVLKSTAGLPCRDVVVTNCVLQSLCNAIKIGTESNGDFEDIAFSNCVIRDTNLAGIALECVDGGNFRRVSVTGIAMRDVRCPIFVRLGNRARAIGENAPKPGPGSMRDVLIRDVQAVATSDVGCSITGLPDQMVRNVTLDNIRLMMPGGREPAPGSHVEEHPDGYPEYRMFGVLPAFGLYGRHLNGVRLCNIEIECARPDRRPAVWVEDAERLSVESLTAYARAGRPATLHLSDVRGASVSGLHDDGGPGLLAVHGRRSREIAFHRSPFTTEAAIAGPELDAAQIKYL